LLTVNADTASHIEITTDNAGDAALELVEHGGSWTNEVFGAANVFGFQLGYDGGDNDLYIKSGDGTTVATRVTIERDSGNVGIGTAAPVTKLTVEGSVTLKEQAAADADTAAYGQVWVKTGTPNTLWFTDDAGTDAQLGTGGGGGGPGATELTSGASYTSTATDDHFYTVNNASLGEMFVLTLPAASAASGASLTFVIKDSNGNSFKVLCAGSDVIWDNWEIINGYGADVTDMTSLYDGYSLTLVSNGSDWYSNSFHDGYWTN
jgi:hypothetical protein